jgi:ABC-2 type transport system permease protein
MNEFLTLFKYELKSQVSFHGKNRKFDIVGTLLSALITLLIVAVSIILISSITKNYVAIKVNKVSNPIQRGLELINLFYVLVVGVMTILSVEKMRKTLTDKTGKSLLLRLPVKKQNIFLSKLAVLFLINYSTGFVLVFAINLIFYICLDVSAIFWLQTLAVWVFLPVVPFLLASLLVVPYIKIVDFVKERYIILFILVTAILVGAFLLYSELLNIVQELLSTGSMKFLFNEGFTNTLQALLKYIYPVNCLSKIAMGQDLLLSFSIVVAVTLASLAAIYYISKALYNVTLYKNEERVFKFKKKEVKTQSNPIIALMRKEFISVFRDSKHMFSYFSIALAMPVMAYCCYTLFEALLKNTLGLSANYSLALIVVLVFSVLTNTFCATNISRDGVSNLKTKLLPIKASTIVLSKVIFCAIVSSLAVIVSSVGLVALTSLTILDGLLVIVVGLLFSLAQILIATRIDLANCKLSANQFEVESQSSKTIAKVLTIGVSIALLIGILSLVMMLFNVGNEFIAGIYIGYIVPVVIGGAYFAFAFLYYKRNIERCYQNLTM